MLINKSKLYLPLLSSIIEDIGKNKVTCLLKGRQTIIKSYIAQAKENITLGEKSEKVLARDINYILDKVFGLDF